MTTINNDGLTFDGPIQDNNQDINTFPDSWKDEFEGMLFIGYLQREITRIPFHKFVVRTLTVNEKLEISLLTKPFMESIGYGRAYKAAVVAAGLVSVDGRDLVPSNKNINIIRQKYEYVVNNWYDSVVDILYNEIEALENRVIFVLQELGILDPFSTQSVFDKTEEESDTPKDGN